MQLLPREQRRIVIEERPDGTLLLIAGFHLDEEKYLHYTSIPFSEFSQTLTCLDDLERFVIDAMG